MTPVPNYLVDTGVFILYFRGDHRAIAEIHVRRFPEDFGG